MDVLTRRSSWGGAEEAAAIDDPEAEALTISTRLHDVDQERGTLHDADQDRRTPKWCKLLLVGVTAVSLFLGLTLAFYLLAPVTQATTHQIQPNDLHAVHDLLLVGYAGVFMQTESRGLAQVQQAALNMSILISELHPWAPCRLSDLAEARLGALNQQAKHSWGCLPHKFKETDFTAVFDEQCITNVPMAKAARNPHLVPDAEGAVSACQGSHWDRVCSYWSGIHSTALWAETQHRAAILPALLMLFWGGATQCSG